jgi:hypothetical protein
MKAHFEWKLLPLRRSLLLLKSLMHVLLDAAFYAFHPKKETAFRFSRFFLFFFPTSKRFSFLFFCFLVHFFKQILQVQKVGIAEASTPAQTK